MTRNSDEARAPRHRRCLPSSCWSHGSRRRCSSTTPTSRSSSTRLDTIRAGRTRVPPDALWENRCGSVVEQLRVRCALLSSRHVYVETFDSRRRCNLYLTYYAHGDTRKRGMALLRFKQTYLGARGSCSTTPSCRTTCASSSSTGGPSTTTPAALLVDHRTGPGDDAPRPAGRARLGRAGSTQSAATLPPLRGDERAAGGRLAAAGPPEEEVGLAPFAAPSFSPGAAAGASPEQTLLPMPSFPGAR